MSTRTFGPSAGNRRPPKPRPGTTHSAPQRGGGGSPTGSPTTGAFAGGNVTTVSSSGHRSVAPVSSVAPYLPSAHNTALDQLTSEIDQLLKPNSAPKVTVPKVQQSQTQRDLGIPSKPPKADTGGSGLPSLGNILSAPVKASQAVAKDLLKESPKEKFDRLNAGQRRRSVSSQIGSTLLDKLGTKRPFIERGKGDKRSTRVTRFQGHKTVGQPYLGAFNKAAQKGKLKLTKQGKVVTPGIAKVERQLRKHPSVSLAGLTPAQRRLAPYDIKAAKITGVAASLLMAQQGQESAYGTNTGPSSAGAFGVSQFIPSTAAAYGVKPGNSPGAIWSQVKGQADYLKSLGVNQNPQAALSSYSGGYSAGTYNNPVLSSAKNFRQLDKGSTIPPKLAAKAKNLGLKVDATGAPARVIKPHRHYVSPFTKNTVTTQSRTDQGVDFTGSGPIVAVGDGVVTHITPNWYLDQPLMTYKLTSGPFKGRQIFVAEGIKDVAPIGTKIKKGQKIAAFAHGTANDSIEMGWANDQGGALASTHYSEGQVTKEGLSFGNFLDAMKNGGTISTALPGVGGGVSAGGTAIGGSVAAQGTAAAAAAQQRQRSASVGSPSIFNAAAGFSPSASLPDFYSQYAGSGSQSGSSQSVGKRGYVRSTRRR